MKTFALIVFLAALVAAVPTSWAQSVGRPKICAGEIREAVAVALKYGVGDVPNDYSQQLIDRTAPAIPDYGILRHDGMIYVHSYLAEAKCSIDASVLPRSTNVAFVLVDDDQLRDLARLHEDGVTYVRASSVQFLDSEVVVRIGVAVRPRPGDERGLLCCCGGEMVLRRASEKWLFVEWRSISCA